MQTSILIPARIRNEQELNWLKFALESARGQGEIIVALNNCETSSMELQRDLWELPLQYRDVKFDEIVCGNLAGARNYLVSQVTTKYSFFLDADDLLPANIISQAESIHSGTGYLYGSTNLFNDTMDWIYPSKPWDCYELSDHVYFPNGVLHLTDNFSIVGKWDESMSVLEDQEWWIRAAEHGVFGNPCDLLMYRYRQSPSGLVQSAKRDNKFEEAKRYIKSQHEKFYKGEVAMCGCNKKRKELFPTESIQPAEGEVLITYNLGTAMTSYYGSVTGKQYRVSGIKRTIPVDTKDLETGNRNLPGLLELRKNGQFIFTRTTE
jgi:glycosyltransferase involved in cell wall biosynthesis